MRMYFDHGEILTQRLEGKIMKENHSPPKFDGVQHKQFLRNAQRAIEEERA